MVFLDELSDVTANRITRVTHRHAMIKPFLLQLNRAFNRPFLSPDCAWEYRA